MENKTCNKCANSYPNTSEYFNFKGKLDKRLRNKCKECERKYRESNKEKLSNYYKEWLSKNIERLTNYRKEYWGTHKEHKKEYDKENRKIYYASHKEEKKADTRNRRAKVKQSQGKHKYSDIEKQYKTQNGKCYWCGVKVGDTYHVDHVIPIARGGANDPSNLVISCPSCNLSKGAKLPHE